MKRCEVFLRWPASGFPMKFPRNSLKARLARSKSASTSKHTHPTATYDGIQAHFKKHWGFKVGFSTIGDVWRARDEWLKVKDDSKACCTLTPKNQSVEHLWLVVVISECGQWVWSLCMVGGWLIYLIASLLLVCVLFHPHPSLFSVQYFENKFFILVIIIIVIFP